MPSRNTEIKNETIVNLYKSGQSTTQIAKTMSISHCTVANRLEEEGIERNLIFNYSKNDKKICRTCNIEKFNTEFYLSRGNCIENCKECHKNKVKNYTQKNKSKKAEYNKKYKEQRKEYFKEYNKEYHKNNSEKIKKHRNRPEIKKARRKRNNIWYKNKMKTDNSFKIAARLRNRIRVSIKRQNGKKSNVFRELIGCSINFLQEYIESLWQSKMSWENYGFYGWHIDHIIPCDAFDLTKKEEQYKCFHYSNLRPLWSTTKIAIEYGENDNYIGNLNKSNHI